MISSPMESGAAVCKVGRGMVGWSVRGVLRTFAVGIVIRAEIFRSNERWQHGHGRTRKFRRGGHRAHLYDGILPACRRCGGMS